MRIDFPLWPCRPPIEGRRREVIPGFQHGTERERLETIKILSVRDIAVRILRPATEIHARRFFDPDAASSSDIFKYSESGLRLERQSRPITFVNIVLNGARRIGVFRRDRAIRARQGQEIVNRNPRPPNSRFVNPCLCGIPSVSDRRRIRR